MSAKINPTAISDNWLGILNLSLPDTGNLSSEDVISITTKLSEVFNNKFYNINIFDEVADRYLGDCELVRHFVNETNETEAYDITNITFNEALQGVIYVYKFFTAGEYTRTVKTFQIPQEYVISETV